MKTRRAVKSNNSATFGVAIGVITAFAISFLLLAGATSLLVSGCVGEELGGVLVFSIRTVALLTGVLVGTGIIKEKHVVFSGVITLLYIALIAGFGIVLYDGSFKEFGLSSLSVMLGGITGCLIRLKLQNKPQRAKRIKV